MSVNSLGFVDAKKPVVTKRQPVTDEVTTVPGFEVTVYPSKILAHFIKILSKNDVNGIKKILTLIQAVRCS